jgi:integrase
LRWENVRREEMELHLPDTKTGFSRRPLSASALDVLDTMRQVPGSPFVFRSIKSAGKPLAYNTVEKAFRRVVETAGVKHCTLHTLWHWYATATANTVSNPRIGVDGAQVACGLHELSTCR